MQQLQFVTPIVYVFLDTEYCIQIELPCKTIAYIKHLHHISAAMQQIGALILHLFKNLLI
jgi:hypothetical protein